MLMGKLRDKFESHVALLESSREVDGGFRIISDFRKSAQKVSTTFAVEIIVAKC